jgi:hypothetical protein
MMDPRLRRQYARYGLAAIRLVNGVAGLVAPERLARRIDPSREPSPATIYAFRLFGIRTILLAVDIATRPDAEQYRLTREAVVIHGSDVLTVAMLAARRQLPRRTAATLGLISTVNVALAVASLEPPP